jgi:hypothetical protein
MQALVVLAVLLVADLLWLLRRGGGSDAPARIVTVAAGLLPEHRRDWGGRWPPSWPRSTAAGAGGGSP